MTKEALPGVLLAEHRVFRKDLILIGLGLRGQVHLSRPLQDQSDSPGARAERGDVFLHATSVS